MVELDVTKPKCTRQVISNPRIFGVFEESVIISKTIRNATCGTNNNRNKIMNMNIIFEWKL